MGEEIRQTEFHHNDFVDFNVPLGDKLALLKSRFDKENCQEEQSNDLTEKHLGCCQEQVLLRSGVMQSMLTHDEAVIRQDCLGYFTERYASTSYQEESDGPK
jgi:hypothetical protein